MNRDPKADTRSEAPGQTPIEYSREHGVTLDWVYRLVRTGRLPHVRRFGRLFITGNAAQHSRKGRANE